MRHQRSLRSIFSDLKGENPDFDLTRDQGNPDLLHIRGWIVPLSLPLGSPGLVVWHAFIGVHLGGQDQDPWLSEPAGHRGKMHTRGEAAGDWLPERVIRHACGMHWGLSQHTGQWDTGSGDRLTLLKQSCPHIQLQFHPRSGVNFKSLPVPAPIYQPSMLADLFCFAGTELSQNHLCVCLKACRSCPGRPSSPACHSKGKEAPPPPSPLHSEIWYPKMLTSRKSQGPVFAVNLLFYLFVLLARGREPRAGELACQTDPLYSHQFDFSQSYISATSIENEVKQGRITKIWNNRTGLSTA